RLLSNQLLSYEKADDERKNQQRNQSFTSYAYQPPIREVLSIGLGAKNTRSMLFVLTDDDLHAYEAYPVMSDRLNDDQNDCQKAKDDIFCEHENLFPGEDMEWANIFSLRTQSDATEQIKQDLQPSTSKLSVFAPARDD